MAANEDTVLPRTLGAAMKLVGMRNAPLAAAMTERGYPMSATTISKILTGNREVKWQEAEAFSEILGCDLEWLAHGPEWFRMTGSDSSWVLTGDFVDAA